MTEQKGNAWGAVVLVLAASIFTCYCSHYLHIRFTLAGANLQGLQEILAGEAPLPFQNRVLFPLLLEGASRLVGGSSEGLFFVLRLLSAIIMYGAIWGVAGRIAGGDARLTAVALGLMVFHVCFSFTHPFEHPADFPDVLFFTLAVPLIWKKARWGIVVLTVIACANRESAAFFGVIWFCLHALNDDWKPKWREAAFAAGLVLLAMVTMFALRYAFAGERVLQAPSQELSVMYNLRSAFAAIGGAHPFTWPVLVFALFAPLTWWLGKNRQRFGVGEKKLLVAAALIMAITFVFGRAEELRVFLPVLVILVLVAVSVESRRSGGRGLDVFQGA